MPEDRDELVQQGVGHLQSAAREVIRATRALLDAAEELVDDPKAVQSLVGSLVSIAQSAAAGFPSPTAGDDDDGDDGGVERIKVS
jgi:hypothetical protein